MADATMLVSIVGQQSVTGPAAAAAAGLNAVNDAAAKGIGVIGNLAAAAGKAALALGAMAAVGVAGAMTASVTAAASFEKQISAIGAVSGATAEQLKELQTLALQLGAQTSFSASEAAQGIEELVKAGVSMSDIMGGAAKASLDLAAAGAVSVKDAAEIASNAMNIFGIKGSEMASVADTIAGAANASAIDVNDFKFSLAASGAVAATVGINFKDLSTGIAVLGQNGLKGSDAGTSLKTMLLNLQPTTKAATTAMKDLGIITADGANQFFTAEGKAKSLAEIAGVLQNATKDLTEQQKIQALETIFGTDAIRAAAIMAREGAAGFNEMAGAIGNISAADVANARLDNLAGSIEKFKGSAETAAITVGLKFTPALKRLVDQATDVLNEALPSLEKFAEQGAAAFDGLITRATKATPLLLSAGTAALAFGRNLLTLAQDAIPLAVREFDRLRGLFEATGGTGGIVSTVERLRDGFRELLPVATSIGRAVADNVVSTFQFLTQRVLPPVLSMLDQAAVVVERTLLPAFTATGTVMRGIFGDTLDWLATTVMPPFLSIVRQTSDFFTTVMLPTLPALAASLRMTLGQTVQWMADDVWPKLRTAATAAWVFISGTIVPALPALAQQLRTLLGGALEWIGTTGWPLLVDGARIAAGFFTGTLVPAITQAIEWLGPKIKDAITWVTETGWPTLVAAGQAVSTWVMGTAIPALTQLWDWLSPKLAAAVQWITDTGWPLLVSAGAAVSTWITGTAIPALSQLWDWLSPKLSAAITWVMETGWPTLVTAGEAVSTWIVDVAAPALSDLVEWLGPKIQTATTWITDTGWPKLLEIGGQLVTMWDDMNTWIADVWTQLSETRTWDNLTAAAGKLWEAGKILVETFWPGMMTGAKDAVPETSTFVKIIEGASELIYYFAAGVEAIAKALRDIKEAVSGLNLPDWLIRILGAGVMPFGPSILAPLLPSGRTNQSQNATGTSSGAGPIDNSSRASFVRTAYPYMLEAAGGDKNLAEMMLATAISENGDVGQGGKFIGNNFFGIKGQGPAGSFNATTWEQEGGQRVTQQGTFAAYNTPVEGFQAFPQFLQNNPRYAGALRRYQETGDAEELFQNINQAGYATDPSWGSTITNIRRNQVSPITAGLSSGNMASGGGMRNAVNLSQTQQQWSQQANDANAICGPYLASLFASAVGRPPTADEARSIAEKFGIYNSAGTGSGILNAGQFDEYATAMIQQLNPGSTTRVEQTMGLTNGAATSLAASSLASGSGITGFNTQGHYFGADQYDPATGKFHVGGTGLSLAGGSEWMSVDEMTAKMGPLIGILTLVGNTANTASAGLAPIGSTLNDIKNAGEAGASGLTATTDAMAPIGETANEVSAGLGSLSESVVSMANEALISVTQMGEGIITTITDTAGNTTTTITDMAGNVTSQVTQMADGTVLKMGDMAAGVLTSTTDLGTGVLTVVSDMAGNYVTTITDLAGNVVTQYTTMANGVTTQTNMMQETASAAAALTNEQVSEQFANLANSAGESFGLVTKAVESSAESFGEYQEAADSIKPPRLGDTVKQFDSVAAAAKKARDEMLKAAAAASEFREGAGGGSRGGNSGLGKRAAGGPVWAGQTYLVGELGPELFSPTVSGNIIPNHRLSMGQDGGIDYDRLASAIVRSLPRSQVNQFYGMTHEQAFVEIERRQEIQLLLSGEGLS